MSLESFAEVMQAGSWDEAADLVERNPALLGPASLDEIAAEARQGADDFTLAAVDDLLDRLRVCAERGDLQPFRDADVLPWREVADRFVERFMAAQESFDRFQSTAQRGELDAAIDRWRDIRQDLDFPSTPVPFQLVVLDGLAASTMMRHLHFQDAGALPRAIDIADEALTRTPRGARLRARRLTNLASMLAARFSASRDARDIDDAIAHAREAIGLTPDSAPELPGRLNSLATALSLRHEQSTDHRDADEAAAVLRHAIESRAASATRCAIASI